MPQHPPLIYFGITLPAAIVINPATNKMNLIVAIVGGTVLFVINIAFVFFTGATMYGPGL